MKNIFVILIAFTATGVVHAQSEIEKFHSISARSLDCKKARHDFENLLPKGKLFSDENGKMPSENLEPAIQLLVTVPTLSADEVAEELNVLKDHVNEVLPDYLSNIGTECNPFRLNLSRWIINSSLQAGVSAERTAKGRSVLKASLLAIHQPTLLNVLIDISIIKHGVKAGLWTVSKQSLEKLESMKAEVKAMGARFNDLMGNTMESLGQMEDLTPGQKADRFKKNAAFQKAKHVFSDEIEAALDFQKQLAKTKEQLK